MVHVKIFAASQHLVGLFARMEAICCVQGRVFFISC
jgi:hypothetical protein